MVITYRTYPVRNLIFDIESWSVCKAEVKGVKVKAKYIPFPQKKNLQHDGVTFRSHSDPHKMPKLIYNN